LNLNKLKRQNLNFFVVFNVKIKALLLHENVITNLKILLFLLKISKNFRIFVYNSKNSKNFKKRFKWSTISVHFSNLVLLNFVIGTLSTWKNFHRKKTSLVKSLFFSLRSESKIVIAQYISVCTHRMTFSAPKIVHIDWSSLNRCIKICKRKKNFNTFCLKFKTSKLKILSLTSFS